MTQNWLGKLKNRDRGIQFIQHLQNIVTPNIFNPRMVYNSHVYSNSNRNLLSMTGKFGEQIEEFSLFNIGRSLSPPIFLILVWFTIALCIQNQSRNLLSMTWKFEEQIEESSLFNTCRTLSPPIFLILVWFTITTHLGTHLRLSVLNYPLTVTIYKLEMY